jgi:hypothetical protein
MSAAWRREKFLQFALPRVTMLKEFSTRFSVDRLVSVKRVKQ